MAQQSHAFLLLHSPKNTIILQGIQSFPKGYNYSPKDVVILHRIQLFPKEYNYSPKDVIIPPRNIIIPLEHTMIMHKADYTIIFPKYSCNVY